MSLIVISRVLVVQGMQDLGVRVWASRGHSINLSFYRRWSVGGYVYWIVGFRVDIGITKAAR
jgi:hypothetical protein